MLKCLPFHEEALINWYNIITTICLNNFLLTCKDFFKGQSHLLRIVEQLIWLHLISRGLSTFNLIFNYIYTYCSIPVFMNSNLSLLNVITSVMFIISYCLDAKKICQFCYCLVLLLLYILKLIWVELNLHMKVKYTSSKLQFSS